MENNNPNNISGIQPTSPVNNIPDILTQASREKFRRRLLIASRLIAILLIGALLWFSFIYYQVGSAYKHRPCWSCGYYYGKKCEPVLIYDLITDKSNLEDFKKTIAEYNDMPINLSQYNVQKYNQDLKDFDLNLSGEITIIGNTSRVVSGVPYNSEINFNETKN